MISLCARDTGQDFHKGIGPLGQASTLMNSSKPNSQRPHLQILCIGVMAPPYEFGSGHTHSWQSVATYWQPVEFIGLIMYLITLKHLVCYNDRMTYLILSYLQLGKTNLKAKVLIGCNYALYWSPMNILFLSSKPEYISLGIGVGT